MHTAERMPALVDAPRPAFLMNSHGSNDSSSRVPLNARLLASLDADDAKRRREKIRKLFQFLVKGDFGLIESSNFRVPRSRALRDVYRVRIEGIGKPESAGTRSIE